MEIEIRQAFLNEAERLTEIAFAAKRTWDYPETYFDIWTNELTVSKEYIEGNIVFVAIVADQIAGFYSIVLVQSDALYGNVLVKKGYWMEHLFIEPKFQEKGIGSKLLKHALDYCIENWIDDLKIFVDPNAVGFYEKMGASFLENSLSSIQGREIPVYRFQFED